MGSTGPAKEDPRGGGVPFGRYAIRARIGRGGMGEVFLADQLGPRGPVRPVALKRVLPRLSQDTAAVELFLSEMQTAGQLNHPNVATTYDFGEIDGVYFLAMEYVDGITLDRLLEHHGRISIGAALAIVKVVADALAYAHDQDVVHQDVTPHNIMVSRTGTVKLLDFGIARAEAALSEQGVRAKVAYAAPEQLEGAPPDRRFDLWALGVVLYEAISGKRPFMAASAASIVQAANAREFDPIIDLVDDASDIAPLIDGALQPNPDKRWSTAESFGRALASIAARRASATPQDLADLVNAAIAAQPEVDLSETSATGVAALDVGVLSALERGPTEATAPSPVAVGKNQRAGSVIALGLAAVVAAVVAAVGFFAWPRNPPAPVVAHEAPKAPVAETKTVIVAPPEPSTPTPEPPPPPEPVHKRITKRRRPAKPRIRPAETVVEEPGKPKLTISPAPSDGLGLLSVRSVPWAKVVLDGRPLGEGVIAKKPVSAGRHVLTLTAGEGAHAAKTVTFEIRPGVTTKIFADLKAGTVRIEP